MANTQVTQIREAVAVSGTAKYRIITTCTLKGTLQDTHIFLLAITQPTDPKNDTFVRVIEIADVDAYGIDRDQAIADGDGFWRSNNVSLIYDDIETANAAWKELSSRINLLVETYDAFLLEFSTPDSGNVIIYPTIDESGKTALKNAYYAANDTLVAAQAALDAHSCDLIETNIDITEERLAEANADLNSYVAIQAQASAALSAYGSIYGTLNTNNNTVRSLNTASSATDGEKDLIRVPLDSSDSYLTQFSAQNESCNQLVAVGVAGVTSGLQARVQSLTQSKNTYFSQLNKCRTEEAKLQAALASAKTIQEEALAAAVAVCPDFSP